ncbi:hypothetical protein GLOTRDRAFT_130436 [Gloeophyllum trabeum ATCC 11539]|uniref:Uncharacterized protein n=1 Tax=Gloeophyllum trabeum (strain ATCC 11539 / FP-39264 / Madison 617) TaxID=670483 RepID=S7RMX3_GLOTA|nr:uncharacterized protein GLOTRDRAFT_130436 [Gloeophyllum trabeum ATCC 11539]EPQ54049.1 hypothetical protein GLOTRDRAFT_130436 [Gloeophyllum trabeum ATCC 11539]
MDSNSFPDPPTFIDGRAARLPFRPASTPARFMPARPNRRGASGVWPASRIEEAADRTDRIIHQLSMQALTSNSYEEISVIVEQLEEELDWFRDTVRTEAASRNREINMDEGDRVRRTMHKGAEAINSLTANLDRMEARRVKRELETRSPTARHATTHPLGERPATPRPSHESNPSSRAIPSPPDIRPNVQHDVGAQIDPVQMPIAEPAPIPIAARQPPLGLPGLPHPPPTGDYRMERIHPYTSALWRNAGFVRYFPMTGQTGAENANAAQDHSTTARTGGAAPADEQGSRRGAEPPPAPVNTPMDQIPTQRSGIGHLGPAEWTQCIGDTGMVSDWQTDPVIQRSIGKLFAPRQPNEDQATFDVSQHPEIDSVTRASIECGPTNSLSITTLLRMDGT